ncbi:GntR family transcriptional regulator [Sagittula salina]|uniref:GntR family transcriptional regulator n=1 Tax=Sagittula salina TaxID=2820268 RepID=A0A940MLX2_9RHOB|nr:GntR family transcriptional regulator [Sagittula salina]MBP0482160.1 GntR family transcriptional regulator [Sagittula salina]
MTIADFLHPADWYRPEAGPRYLQLRNRLSAGVEGGQLPPGAPLPPEREIATITEFSRVTVRKAIQSLVDEGRIVQRQGSGSFVAPTPARVNQALTRLTSFTEDMARRGLTVTARWLERGFFLPTPEEVDALSLHDGDSVARIARLRLADGAPMAIERASLPTDILPNPLEVAQSLYAVLEAQGTMPVRAVQKLTAVIVDGPDAELLDLAPGAPGLRMERTSFLASGRVCEFTQSLYRADAYTFVADLTLGGEP